jgi:hypothetical protein
MKVLIVTACGTEKNPRPMPAIKLYKSSRVKAVYNRRGSSDMCILSAEYGLVDANDIIKPYERVMDEQRAKELTSSVAEKLQDYDYVIFFKGGARKAYLTCIENACEQAGKSLVILGFANIGGVNDLPVIIELLKRRRLTELSSIKHVKVFFYKPN